MKLSPAAVLVLACATAACPAKAQAITLDAGFDHGSLKNWAVTPSLGNTPTINLVGRDNFFGDNQWRWLYFRADGVAGTQPTFSISDNFAGGASRLTSHPMVYSYDNETWHFFDTNARNGRGRFFFGNDTTFEQDSVYVAYAFPYSYGRSVEHTQQVLATPWAVPTASGDANGVIGQSPGGVDDLGRTIEPRDIFGYRITNPATDAPDRAKHKIVVMTGMHAGETLGTHTFQGLVDWLISPDPTAAALRDVAEVFAYPTANPDGRFAGNSRATVENPDRDPNGFWNPSLWVGHEDIQANGQAMLADTAATPGAGVDIFVDFHSTIPSFPGDDFGFIEEDQGDDQSAFWQALLDIQPNILQTDSTGTSWTSANFADIFLGAEADVTFETQFGFDRPIEYYHTMGANFGRAFAAAFGVPEPASLTLLGLGAAGALTRRR